MQKCPLCGCRFFHLRDPEDEYELSTFEVTPEGIVFQDGLDPEAELRSEREVFCDRCSWRGTCDDFLIGREPA